MYGNIKLSLNADGSYDIIINYDKNDTEFSLDFLSLDNIKKQSENISEYLKEHAKEIKVKTVKIAVGGILVTSMAFGFFMQASAATDKYSMAYLYGGSPSQQITYVDRTKGAIDTVSPSYFDINADGSLKLNAVNAQLVDTIHAQGMKVVPFLSNHWNQQAGINSLKDIEGLSTKIAQYIEQYKLDGINVDLENLTPAEKTKYVEFVAALRNKIPETKEVSVAVAANPKGRTSGWVGSYDYKELAQHADYLMIMAYDEHWQGSDAGAVASAGFIEDSVKYALTQTTSDKLVVGLPFYGRIWSADGSFNGNSASLNVVNQLVTDYKAVITNDVATGTPKAEFTIKAGDKVTTIGGKQMAPGLYTVWFDNDSSIANKLSLVQKYNLKGTGSWALGNEPATIWNGYSSWLNGTAAPVQTTPTTPVKPVTPVTPAPSTQAKTIPVTPKVPAKPVAPPKAVTKKTTAALSVRSGPSVSSKKLGTLPKGAKVTVLGKTGNFTKISYGKTTAYVSSNYIK